MTCIAFGARLLRRRLLSPRTDVAEIRRRLDAVELFVTQPGLRKEIRARLDNVSDVERLAVKLAVDRIGPRELVALRSSLAELPGIDDALSACRDPAVGAALGIHGEEKRPPASGKKKASTSSTFVDRCQDLCSLLASA